MAIVTIASASGAPGVSTTALMLGLQWPRPAILVDADPKGGSTFLAGYMHGEMRPGLVELIMAHQQHLLPDALPRLLVEMPNSNLRVLPGLRTQVQAAAAGMVWQPLLAELRRLSAADGVDTIIDVGRLGMAAWPQPLVLGSDVLVLMSGTGLPELAAVQPWLTWLQDAVAGPTIAVLLAGEGRPYSAGEVTRQLDLPVVGVLPRDEQAARKWSHGEQPAPLTGWVQHLTTPRSTLMPAVAHVAERLLAMMPAALEAVDIAEQPSEVGQ